MAPQPQIPLPATILGTIGTIFWCIQLLPQVLLNHRTKRTEGLPALMMYLWSLCGVPFGIYAVVQNFAIPIQIQPHCFMFFCLWAWGQCLRYGHKWSRAWATGVTVGMGCVFAVVEGLGIWLLKRVYRGGKGTEWPVQFVGVMAAVLLIVGYVPVPFEIWKRRGRVVGIDFGFLTIDWLGAVFSLMAIVAQHTFDPLGGVMYAMCAAIEAGIFVSHGIWLLRTRKIRQRVQEAEARWEDFPEAQAWEENRLRFRGDWICCWGPRGREAHEEIGKGESGPSSENERVLKSQDVDVEQCSFKECTKPV